MSFLCIRGPLTICRRFLNLTGEVGCLSLSHLKFLQRKNYLVEDIYRLLVKMVSFCGSQTMTLKL